MPFITHPHQLSFPTSVAQGTLNKTVAFSQYPHSTKNSGAEVCPFFCDGSCYPEPGCGIGLARGESEASAADSKLNVTLWMGFSVRDASHRYTAWIPYNGTRAQWPDSKLTRNRPFL